MAVATRTLLQLCQAVADNLAIRENGTATDGSTVEVACSSYPFMTGRANVPSSRYEGSEIRCDISNTGYEAREIIAYSNSTGTFTVSPKFSANAAADDLFDIYKRGVRYSDISTAVNKALRERYYTTTVPLSLVTNADMETVNTGWTDSGATSTWVQTAGNLYRGAYSLHVANSSADDHTQSDTINVQSNTGYLLEASCRAAVGTAELVAYDVTNSAEIQSDTHDDVGWGKIKFNFTTPGTCEQIAVRLQGQGASDEIYWDDVILLRIGGIEYILPDYIITPGQIKSVFRRGSRVGDHADTDIPVPTHHYSVLFNENNPLAMYKIRVVPASSTPIWMEVIRHFEELSADTSTLAADRKWIETAATVELLEKLKRRPPSQETQQWQKDYDEWRLKLVPLDHMHMLIPPISVRFPTPPSTPGAV